MATQKETVPNYEPRYANRGWEGPFTGWRVSEFG